MNSQQLNWALKAIAAAGVLVCSIPSHALTAQISQFSITKNGNGFFSDNFTNGLTPSQEPSTYSVTGSFQAGADAGGLLTLDTDWGAPVADAAGQVNQVLSATMLSNVSAGDPRNSLTSNSKIAVLGIFNLVSPSGPASNGFGIQVQDTLISGGATQTDRSVQINVQYLPRFGGDVVLYSLQDFTAGTITALGIAPLAAPNGANQIELLITHPSRISPAFFGAYAYGTNGSFGSFTQFGTSANLFTDTKYVRARFGDFAALPVPEPASALLMLLGAGVLAVTRRRREH